jgi:hypothetical protein
MRKTKFSERAFWGVLRTLRGRKGFKLTPEGFIRQKYTGTCPVSAVCNELHGTKYDEGDYGKAASRLGTSSMNPFIHRIASAADNPRPEWAESARLRKRLERACGLTSTQKKVKP